MIPGPTATKRPQCARCDAKAIGELFKRGCGRLRSVGAEQRGPVYLRRRRFRFGLWYRIMADARFSMYPSAPPRWPITGNPHAEHHSVLGVAAPIRFGANRTLLRARDAMPGFIHL